MRAFSALTFLLCACGADTTTEPLVPADYETSWTEIQGCTEASVHSGDTIRIFLNDTAKTTWDDWAQRVADGNPPDGESVSFAPGSVLLKAQYSDASCNDFKFWTVMTKLDAGEAAAVGDWRWEMIAANENGDPGTPSAGGDGCFGCHQGYAGQDYVGTSP